MYYVRVGDGSRILFESRLEARWFLMSCGYEKLVDPFGREFWARGTSPAIAVIGRDDG